MAIVEGTIQIAGATAAEWLVDDPILLDKQPGLETDTGIFKIGDGVTAWSALLSAGRYIIGRLTVDAPFGSKAIWLEDDAVIHSENFMTIETDGGTILFQTDGTLSAMDLRPDAQVTAAVAKVNTYGAGSTSATAGRIHKNSAGTIMFVEFDNGCLQVGSAAPVLTGNGFIACNTLRAAGAIVVIDRIDFTNGNTQIRGVSNVLQIDGLSGHRKRVGASGAITASETSSTGQETFHKGIVTTELAVPASNIDWAAAAQQYFASVTTALTLTFTNDSNGGSVEIVATQGGGGSINFPAGYVQMGSESLALNATLNKRTWYSLRRSQGTVFISAIHEA